MNIPDRLISRDCYYLGEHIRCECCFTYLIIGKEGKVCPTCGLMSKELFILKNKNYQDIPFCMKENYDHSGTSSISYLISGTHENRVYKSYFKSNINALRPNLKKELIQNFSKPVIYENLLKPIAIKMNPYMHQQQIEDREKEREYLDNLIHKKIKNILTSAYEILKGIQSLKLIEQGDDIINRIKTDLKLNIYKLFNYFREQFKSRKDKFSLPKDTSILTAGCLILTTKSYSFENEIFQNMKNKTSKFKNKVNRFIVKLQKTQIFNPEKSSIFIKDKSKNYEPDYILNVNMNPAPFIEKKIILESDKETNSYNASLHRLCSYMKIENVVINEISKLCYTIMDNVWFGGKNPKNIIACSIYHILSGECTKIKVDSIEKLKKKWPKEILIKTLCEQLTIKEKMLFNCNILLFQKHECIDMQNIKKIRKKIKI